LTNGYPNKNKNNNNNNNNNKVKSKPLELFELAGKNSLKSKHDSIFLKKMRLKNHLNPKTKQNWVNHRIGTLLSQACLQACSCRYIKDYHQRNLKKP
jgi:hypothetical protein